MPAYLLAWNPRVWSWPGMADDIRAIAERGFAMHTWSCGSARRIREGDRAFLIRLGVEPKGIVGAGTIARERYEEPHFDPERAAAGVLSGQIDVRFDTLLDPARQPPLPREFLRTTAPFSAMHWDTRMSGVRIPDPVAVALEVEWAALLGSIGAQAPR